MKNRLLLIVCGLLFAMGCCVTPVPKHITTNTHIMDSTVALVDEGRPYCAGTWISQTQIITAAHCVIDRLTDEPRKEVEIAFQEDVPREYKTHALNAFKGAVVKTDQDTDLALIVVKDVPPHCFSALAPTDSLLGEHLRIVGHPIGLTWTYMEGISNGLRSMKDPDDEKKKQKMLQVIAPVFFGNSGGGAFNAEGQLVGVCSFIVRAPEQSFFVPVSVVTDFLRKPL